MTYSISVFVFNVPHHGDGSGHDGLRREVEQANHRMSSFDVCDDEDDGYGAVMLMMQLTITMGDVALGGNSAHCCYFRVFLGVSS